MGVRVIGTQPPAIKKAEDRLAFQETMLAIGEPCVDGLVVESVEDACAFAERIFQNFRTHKEELSARLSSAVTRYADYRIYPADRAVLLLALTEISYLDDVPPVVSVSEATALARKYSTERSADFVNGVLGGVINK